MRRFALTVLFVLGILVFMPSVVCAGYPYREETVAIGAEGSEFQRAFINCTDAITTETLNYAPAWLSGWKYRKKITIDHTKIDSNLKNFPVLVKLTSSNFDFSKARSDGYDIRFTASDGTTLLKYERERHDSINQVAEYWVKIPSVSSSTDTEFYIYYGKSDATDGADPTNVWDSYFKAVWHLKDGNDSSSSSLTLTKKATSEPSDTDGKIDGAQNFDGLDDYMCISNPTVLQPGDSDYAIEAWIKIDDWETGNCICWYSGNGWSVDGVLLQAGSDGRAFFSLEDISTVGGERVRLAAEDALSLSTWYYLVGVADRSAGLLRLYVNGVEKATASLSSDNTPYPDWYLYVGRRPYVSERHFDGIIDELRISKGVLRTPAWIKASYHSGNDSLLTYGSEEKSTKVLFLKTDKTNYSLGDVVRLGIKLNYTKECLPVYARFKLELEEPVGEPDVLFQTNLFPLLPGFNVTKILKFKIPQTFWIPEGEYAFKATLTDSLGREIDSDVARFYVNDTLKVHYLEFDAV